MEVFEKDSYNSHNGVDMWKGKVPLGQGLVSIQYNESENIKSLMVWPPSISIRPDQMDQDRKLLENIAREAIRFLVINGGWSFGPPSMKGKNEHATTDRRIMSQIPAEVEPLPSSGLKIDRSTGPRELETIHESDRERARAIFEEETMEKLLRVEEGHTELVIRERE